MPGSIDTHGDIEIICQTAAELAPNKIAKIVFRAWEDATPPFEIKVWSPSGNVIVERVIRELPTGQPQSPPPISFSVQRGNYEIVVHQIKGSAEGKATLTVT
ncbi:MAG: hypothetical protein RIF41_40105 [Polyangiaceae bacterium]